MVTPNADSVGHIYVNPFVQCHPGNPLCVPMEGHCKVCGQPKDHPSHNGSKGTDA